MSTFTGTVDEFVMLALVKAPRGIDPRTGQAYRGVHTVYSGLNAAIKDVFGLDPVIEIQRMVKAKAIAGHPARGGYMVYTLADAPKPKAASALLEAMGIGDDDDARVNAASRNASKTRNGPVVTRNAK